MIAQIYYDAGVNFIIFRRGQILPVRTKVKHFRIAWVKLSICPRWSRMSLINIHGTLIDSLVVVLGGWDFVFLQMPSRFLHFLIQTHTTIGQHQTPVLFIY